MAVIRSEKKKMLTCSVLTRGGPIIKGTRISYVEVPAASGYLTIHYGHCSCISEISYGVLSVFIDNDVTRIYIETGIVEVADNSVGILVDIALRHKDINPSTIEREIENIKSQHAINFEEVTRNHNKILRLNAQIDFFNHYQA